MKEWVGNGVTAGFTRVVRDRRYVYDGWSMFVELNHTTAKGTGLAGGGVLTILHRASRHLIFVGLMVALYLAAPWIVFDMRQPAYAFDEEYFEGVRVAYGPRPRLLIASPSYHAFLYDGTEWPFKVFRIFCESWLSEHQFAKPSQWRKNDEMGDK